MTVGVCVCLSALVGGFRNGRGGAGCKHVSIRERRNPRQAAAGLLAGLPVLFSALRRSRNATKPLGHVHLIPDAVADEGRGGCQGRGQGRGSGLPAWGGAAACLPGVGQRPACLPLPRHPLGASRPFGTSAHFGIFRGGTACRCAVLPDKAAQLLCAVFPWGRVG